MPVTLNSTGISFSDGNSQNTVASGGLAGDFTRSTFNSPGSVSGSGGAFA